ncbi:MAG: nucleotidyltransferase domain-containing protein [Candidatus Parvarchaeota archaeon]|nr:nucleotidyltransferase domain-containing protein [Candidatus Parvarchaeota archaeon]
MHQTENVNPADSTLNKFFASIELLSSKIDELNERVDYMSSFIGLQSNEEEKTQAEPPGQLAGISFNIINQLLDQKDANAIRAYFLRILGMFHRYIKSIILFGSAKTKNNLSPKSDIDVAFIVDDTDIRKFTLKELKERLFIKMAEIAKDFSDKIHSQAYPLSEFWLSIVKPNPVILTILKDGIAVYDTGFFVPLQMLYKSGNILPTKESVDSNILTAEELLNWADDTLSKKLTNDLFNSVVSAGQSLLMEMGYLPPTPRDVSKELESIAVEKEHILSKEDVEAVADIVKWYKDIDHGEVKSVSGEEYSKKYNQTKKVVDKILKEIEKLREKKGMPKPIIDESSFKKQEKEGADYVPKGKA